MSKLNPNAQKWVDALRSGKYQQATSFLRNGDRFCCLGVACDISGIGNWSGNSYVIKGYGSSKLIPDEVQKWLGLRDNAGYISGDPEGTHLAFENDHGATFERIASLIEEHAKELGVAA
jgi:hypothetical protein